MEQDVQSGEERDGSMGTDESPKVKHSAFCCALWAS